MDIAPQSNNDLLFGPIYERFVNTNQNIFLELLEKYILCDRVYYIPAIIMQDFISYLKKLNRLTDVEKSVLHLDPRQLDIDGVVRLCAENKLYDALIYIFNKGINEYAEPIKYIVRELIEENNEISSSSSSSDDNKNTESSFTKMTTKYFSNKLFEYIVKVIGQHDNSNNNSATTTTTLIDASNKY